MSPSSRLQKAELSWNPPGGRTPERRDTLEGSHGDFDSPRQRAGIEKGKSYWGWKLTDPIVRENKDGAVTPEAIRSYSHGGGKQENIALQRNCATDRRVDATAVS
jgi:hypothetical protein